MKLANVMSRQLRAVEPDDPVYEAARLMRTHDIGALPVVLEGQPIGVLTDRDITMRVTAVGADPRTTRCIDAMTPDPVWLYEDNEVEDAIIAMKKFQVRRVLICDCHGHVTGVVSLGDLALNLACDDGGELLRRICEPIHMRSLRAVIEVPVIHAAAG